MKTTFDLLLEYEENYRKLKRDYAVIKEENGKLKKKLESSNNRLESERDTNNFREAIRTQQDYERGIARPQ